MAITLSPSVPFEPTDVFAFQQWMLQMERMLRTAGAISWASLDLTGSDINALGGTPLTVVNGGTGRTTSTTAYGLLAAGTTDTGAHQTLAAGATTDLLVGGGASALPIWTAATGSGAPVRANTPTLITPVLGVATATSLQSIIGNVTPAASSFTTVGVSGQITSTLVTGTAPLIIASTTKVTNLNVDLLDDQTGSYYLDSANFTGTNWTDLTDTGATTLHKHDHGGQDGLADNDHPQYLLVTDIDDVAVNGEIAQPISSNWAFDHSAASDPHTGYRLESADHSHQSTGAEAGQLDHGLALTGLTDDDHGHYWNYARGAARMALRI